MPKKKKHGRRLRGKARYRRARDARDYRTESGPVTVSWVDPEKLRADPDGWKDWNGPGWS